MLLKLDPARSENAFLSGARGWATPWLLKATLWGAVAILAAALAANWVVELRRPSPTTQPTSVPKIDMSAAVENAATASLFGITTMEPVARAPALEVKLKGVFAGDGERIGAIVNTGGQDRFVEIGREIGPNLRLAAVHASYIVVERDGTKQRVDLGRLESSGGARRATAQPASAPAPAPPPLPENAPTQRVDAPPGAQPLPPGMAPPAANVLPENASPPSPPAPVSSRGPETAWA